MRIVIFSNTAWSVYNYRRNLIALLKDEGFEVHVIAPPDKYSAKVEAIGITYHKLSMNQSSKNPLREIIVCSGLFTILKKIQPDTVLSFTTKCNLYTGIVRRVLRFEQIANISGLGDSFDSRGPLSTIVKLLYRYCLRKAKRIFFQNSQDMDLLVREKLVDKNRCTRILGSGVDIERFKPVKVDTPRTSRRFLMFGRLVAKKRYDLFIEAAENILKQGYDAQFQIMGIKDKSRKSSARLYDYIIEKYKTGVIKYIEACDNVADVLCNVDAVVLPSEYNEGVPRSLLEAAACGKPIITTDRKGCRDTLNDGISGYLIEPGDLDSLQNAIIKMIKATDQQLIQMGNAARLKAEEQFNERLILNEYLKEIKV